MPFINKNPLISNKPELPKKPDAKMPQNPVIKKEHKDESWFRGRPQVSKYEIGRSLRKDPKTRNYLKRELKLKNQKEVDAKITELEKRIPERFGGFIDKAEAKRSMYEEYWNEKRDIREKLKDGITVQESKEIAKRKKEGEFLKKKFGIK